jgi:hypothetical protein
MRFYLIDGSTIVAESAGDNVWCREAMNARPAGIITDAPIGPALGAWGAAAGDHRYYVNRSNAIGQPFVNAALGASVWEHWRTEVGYPLLTLEELDHDLAAAWLSGDDRLPDEDERLTNLDREAGYLDDMWMA